MAPLNRPAARLVVYVLLAVVVTWPMVLDPVGSVVGHPEASVGCHVWLVWWAQHHLTELVYPGIFHPFGADMVRLYGSDLVSPLVLGALPGPPALLYNGWVLFLLTLGAAGADRLALRTGASAGGALCAGVFFGSAPFFQHETLNGTSELLAAGLLPWFTEALLDVLDADRLRWRAGVRLGVLTGVGVGASAYNLFFMLTIGACLALYRVSTQGAPVLTRPVVTSGAVGVAVAAVFAVPMAVLQAIHGAGATFADRLNWTAPEMALPDAFADVLAWFDPRATPIPAQVPLPTGGSFAYWTTCTVYIGWVAIGLAVVGMVRARRLGPWAVLTGVGLLLASGPYLRVGGEDLVVDGHRFGLPGLAVAALFPAFVIAGIHAYRFASVVTLGMAMLVSQGARGGWWALVIGIEAVLLSPVPWPAPLTPIPAGPVLEDLAARPDGAVLSLPAEVDDLGDLGRVLAAQMAHGKPVQDGGIHRRAGSAVTGLYADVPLLAALTRVGGASLPGPADARYGFARLYDAGYRYVLVGADAPEIGGWFEARLGPPVAQDPDRALWLLPADGVQSGG